MVTNAPGWPTKPSPRGCSAGLAIDGPSAPISRATTPDGGTSSAARSRSAGTAERWSSARACRAIARTARVPCTCSRSTIAAVRSNRRAFRTILPIFGILRALMRDPVEREFLLGFWKIHILHHAEKHGVYGQWLLEELRHHGYHVSPGTMYPILNRMAQHG